jgi:hypothetical protein
MGFERAMQQKQTQIVRFQFAAVYFTPAPTFYIEDGIFSYIWMGREKEEPH